VEIEMRKNYFILFLIIVTMISMKVAFAEELRLEPNPDEVCVYFSGVKMPLNRIILIRRENSFCALKFTRAWLEMDEERLKLLADDIRLGGATAESARESAEKRYADYDSYFNRNGAPDFSNGIIQKKEGTASLLPLRGAIRPFIYQPGNGCVECGSFKLLWSYKTGVSFIPVGKSSSARDYGIELAPTPWTDINEVNINDSRIKWYRYDDKRKRVFIPINGLWEDAQKK
jgi:hypothetical protein